MKQVNLFTSNFKKMAKRLLGAVLFVFVFLGIGKVLEFALNNDTNEWSRVLFHDFYAKEENIDTLFLGSSHVYCGVNPAIVSKEAGTSAFNMATPAQPLNGSYYLLKEADKKHDIKEVYLELSFELLTGELGQFKTADRLPDNWRNTNYMKMSWNKMEYMLTMSEPSMYYMTFLPARRYWTNIFEFDKVKETIRQKRTDAYRDYYMENMLNGVVETYVEDGFYYSEHRAAGGVLYDVIKPEPLQERPVTDDAQVYLKKIVEYCEKENIKLTLYAVPITDYQVSVNGDYDLYVEHIREIAAQYGLEYYDFNLCKQSVLDLTKDELFRDEGHLNIWGAEKFSYVLAQFMNEQENGTFVYENYFYPSYKEKIANGRERIMGLVVEKYEEAFEGKAGFCITPVHNLKENDIQYQISLLDENGNKQIVYEWYSPTTQHAEFLLAPEGKVLCIEARPEGEKNATNTVQIAY